jgi:hypothetical protein
MASYAAADRIGHALPQPTPELLQGFDTATQITALAHWFRHQPSFASLLAARAFAMPCASPFGAPLGPPALGWLPRLLPVNGRIVGCRAVGREGSVGLGVSRWRWPQALPGRRTLAAIRAQRPANPRCAFFSCRGAQAGVLVSAAGGASSLPQISECVP